MNHDQSPESSGGESIKVSLFWLVLGLAIVLAVGIVGGVIGQELFGPDLPELTNENGEQLVTTIQQVTVSPNEQAADVVRGTERSVVALGVVVGDEFSMIATGLVVTSDGLLVSTTDVPREDVVAVDSSGEVLDVDLVGDDELYGLRYFRLRDGVFVPVDLLSEDPAVGSTFLGLSRHEETFRPRVFEYLLEEYSVPNSLADGIQRVLQSSPNTEALLTGSPVVNDESQVAGMLLDPQAGVALPALTLRESIDRVIEQNIELNPFEELGIQVSYSFVSIEGVRQFAPTVTAVTSRSSASVAGLEVGDVVTRVGDTDTAWSTEFATQLSDDLPLEITVTREEQEHTLTLRPES